MNISKMVGAIMIAALLAACGGGGGAGGSTIPSHTNTSQSKGTLKITVSVPASKTQSTRAIAYLKQEQSRFSKRRFYVSGATTEIDFTLSTVNGTAATSSEQAQYDFTIYTGNSSQCTPSSSGYTCSATEPAPAGVDGYEVQAQQCSVSGSGPSSSCSGLGGTLALLSQTYFSANVVLDQTVVAAFTFSGVVASLDWADVTYATTSGGTPLNASLWIPQPNGTASPTYNASSLSYSCNANVGSGTGNGCYEPAAEGSAVAYGEVLEARDSSGALIIGPTGGAVYQTPLYLDQNGDAITINWSCADNTGSDAARRDAIAPNSLVWETGGGPYSPSNSAPLANQSFNSPIANPASDPDGGYTVDGNGNPVTAVGNNGAEMNFDGLDQPSISNPDSCTASTSNGISTNANFYLGIGSGGISFTTSPSPMPTAPLPNANATVYELNSAVLQGQSVLDLLQYGNGATEAAPSAVITSLPASLSGNVNGPVLQGTGVAFDQSGNLWVSFGDTDDSPAASLVEYAGMPGTGATPERVIYPETSSGLSVDLGGVAFDSQGNMYGTFDNSIMEYASTANGAAEPIRTIAGTNTLLSMPRDLAIDASGNIWVANNGSVAVTSSTYPGPNGGPTVLEFASSATGNQAPAQALLDGNWNSHCGIIAPAENSGFATPAMAFDANGNLVLFESSYATFFILPPGFTDATCPTSYFENTPFGTTAKIAVDDSGYIYFVASTQTGGGGFFIYNESQAAAFTNGADSNLVNPIEALPTAAPAAATGLYYPTAVAVKTTSGWASGDTKHRAVTTPITHKP